MVSQGLDSGELGGTIRDVVGHSPEKTTQIWI